jgi:hypothetical protein
MPFSGLLPAEGIITEPELEIILKKQEDEHLYIGEALVEVRRSQTRR